MTTFYSDHYSPLVGVTGHFTTLLANPPMLPAGRKHGRVRRTESRLLVPSGQDLGNGDIIRMFDLKSGDRLLNLYFSMDADWGAVSTFHIGLYKKGLANDGVVIDADLFAGTIDWAGAIARVDYFDGANGALGDLHRGQPLWYLADVGAGTYTADPFEIWTVAVTTTQDISAAAGAVEMLAEAVYLAGD